eukprot:CAMPEP_0184405906 /NCGR_PEP_ID=MMETSP0738-20130409/1140_1 /TAXON_ID=385413 /ORGANISM="Thalassiosira miniscula, Strain CCMP1093" /LENGTH=257 /DNA_ID=CAMNT_0026762599 /DNA_START=54 /DNA_END=828 /DNA_ORIENTATION=+
MSAARRRCVIKSVVGEVVSRTNDPSTSPLHCGRPPTPTMSHFLLLPADDDGLRLHHLQISGHGHPAPLRIGPPHARPQQRRTSEPMDASAEPHFQGWGGNLISKGGVGLPRRDASPQIKTTNEGRTGRPPVYMAEPCHPTRAHNTTKDKRGANISKGGLQGRIQNPNNNNLLQKSCLPPRTRAEERSGVPPSHKSWEHYDFEHSSTTTTIHNSSNDATKQCRHDIARKGVMIRLAPGSRPTARPSNLADERSRRGGA